MICADDLPAGGRARREARVLAKAGHLVTVYGVLTDGAEPEEDEGGFVLVRVAADRWRRPRGGLGGVLAASRYFSRSRPIVELALTRDPPESLHVFGVDAAEPVLEASREHGLPMVLDDAGGAAMSSGDDAHADGAGLGDALRRLRSRGAAIEKKVRKHAFAAISTSDSLADDEQARFGGRRPVVLRDCPPLRRLRPSDALRVKLGIHPADRVVVFHGPPDRAHGVESAIRALRVLGERVVLVVIGAAWCQDRLLAVAAEAGVLAQVRVTSTIGTDETLRLLASAEVAVLPLSNAHRATRLGLPAALLDELMAGVPVIVPDVPEAGGLVRRFGAGIVIPAAAEVRPDDIAAAIGTILSDAGLRASCAAAARKATYGELNWEKESARLVDLYDEISSTL